MSEQRYSYPNESFSGCDMVATMLVQKPNDAGKIIYSVGELQTISYSIHMDRKPIRSIGNINAKDYVMGPRTIAGSLVFAVFNKHFAKKIMDEMQDNVESDYAFLMDELPPIDIVLSLANEYGLRSKIAIYGVRLVNEGQVMSVNDVYTENTYQFVATDIEYLTDDNNYTSSSNYKTNRYLIEKNGETDSVDFYKLSAKNNKKSNIEVFSSTELSYQRKSKANAFSLGMIEFTLSPKKNSGYINIDGTKKLTIDLSALENTKSIQIPLPQGKYSAYWYEGNSKSNEITFLIEYEELQNEKEKPAPLIENITENSILVTSNVKSHDYINYQDESKNTYSLKLNGAKQARIINLQSNSYYNIYTSTENKENISKIIQVKTLTFGFDIYADFIKYLMFNKKVLKESDFELYTNVVYKAKNYNYINSNKYKSITETFYEVQNEYLNKIALLNREDFPSEYEYQKELDKNNKFIDVSSEIISISNKIVSNKVYGFNQEFIVAQPPQLEVEDFSTQNLIIEKGVERLVFFRKTNNSEHYYKTISKKNFLPYYNDNDKFICNFIGRPKEKYFVYAENINEYKSPRVDLYILSEEEKESSMIKTAEEQESIAYEKEKVNYSSYALYNNAEEYDKDLLELETIKTVDKKVLNDVYVERIDNYNFRVIINNDMDLLIKNNVKVVISNLDESLKNGIKLKKDISEDILFNVSEAGVKSENYFSVWLEDEYEEQISNCIVFDILSSYTKTDSYLIKEEIKNIQKYMANNNFSSTLLDSIFSNITNDEEVIRSNLLNTVLNNIIANINILSNGFNLLTCFLKYYFEKFTILENFFSGDISFDESNKSLILNNEEEIKAIIYNINSQINIEYIEVNNNKIILDQNYRYNIINFIKSDLSYRSGFFVIDNKTQKTYSYILPLKVGG